MSRETGNWRLVKDLTKPTLQEIRESYDELKTFPFGQLLVSTFQQHTREDELMWGNGIVGNVTDEGIDASMILSSDFHSHDEYKVYDSISLAIYNGRLDEIPSSGVVIGSAVSIARISAQASETGTWMLGQGNRRKWTLYMDLGERGHFYLPSKTGKWTLGLLADIARSASEFYNPLRETPDFYDGQDLERPPR